ncbi:MAG: CPBP family intramembrane metalloprotease [Bacillota bacterium]|nr:CPBP family intramembrane metalloprotease [Bacillota bacterium]
MAILFLAFLVLPLLAVGALRAGETLRLLSPAGEGQATLVALAMQEVGLLGLTLASVKWGYGRSWQRIGLTSEQWGREFGVGLLAVAPLYAVQEAGMKLSLWGFRLFLPAEAVSRLLAEENAALAALIGQVRPLALAFGAVLVLLAPLAEEVFFRGFIQEVFRERLGSWRAVAAAALLFAVIHRYAVQFLPVFLVGLLLSALYEWRRSLTAGITAHAALNFLALLELLKDLP